MAFPSFGSLSSTLSRATNISANLGLKVGSLTSRATGFAADVQSKFNSAQNITNNTRNLFNDPSQFLKNPGNVVSAARQARNLSSGLLPGAAPQQKNFSQATVTSGNNTNSGVNGNGIGAGQNGDGGAGGAGSAGSDWRVNLSVPSNMKGSPLFQNFSKTNGTMIFPFNPTVLFSQTANYSQVHPTHSNYPYNAYQNSQVDVIQISGEFFTENQEDGQYFLSVVWFLRTMTKMFYGGPPYLGNPPMICRLNGYGPHVLNNIPVLVQSFTLDLPNEVDYIPVNFDNQTNYVPTSTIITTNLLPQYSRKVQSQFNLTDFASGKLVGPGSQGFI